MIEPQRLTFASGQQAIALQVDDSVEFSAILQAIALPAPRPVLVIVGGASEMSADSLTQLRQLFVEGIAPVLEELNACAIDGGTDTGVMQMMGQARAAGAAQFPLIGVAPQSKIALPNEPQTERHALEPHHTHFILTPGAGWGTESPWMAKLASILSGSLPSLTLLINGGKTALIDVQENARAGRSVVVLAGSGRLADRLVAALQQPEAETEPALLELAQTQQIEVFNLSESIEAFQNLLRQKLSATPTASPEAIAESDRHFAPPPFVENTPPNQTLLTNAWQRQQTYSRNASAAQTRFTQLRVCIVVLTALGAVLAVVNEELPDMLGDPESSIVQASKICLLIVSLLLTILLAGAVRFDKGSNWVLLRGSSEALKREIFFYRCRVGAYRVNRDSELARRIKLISERLKGSPVHQASFDPYEQDAFSPPSQQSSGEKNSDDRFDDLTPDKYLVWRLEDQFNRYRNEAKRLDRRIHWLQWGIFILGGTGAFLVATDRGIWVAVTAAVTAALASLLELKRAESTLIGYNQAADNLYDTRVWWNALTPDEQRQFTNFELLVQTVEGTIQSENDSWLQDMQDRLADLYRRSDEAAQSRLAAYHDTVAQLPPESPELPEPPAT